VENLWVFYLVSWIDFALGLVVAALAVWAFADCLTKAPAQFQRAFKRTKGFWLALTGGAAAFSALGLVGGGSLLIALIAATVAGVYLADVRPAVGSEPKGPSTW
jgi:multisubunit Na+/H+ antiporter MnhE subunit